MGRARPNTQTGFTIIELMIALTFISFLLVFIVVMTLRFTQMYSKGATLKSINQSSRTLVERMARDIAASSNPVAHGFDADSDPTTPDSTSILCTGSTVYLWNSLTVMNTIDASTNPIAYTGDPDKYEQIRLIRSGDTSLCNDTGKVSLGHAPTNEELLPVATNVLDISLDQITNKLYKLTVKLGTSDKEAYDLVEDPAGGVCKPGREGEFCAAAKFERIIYAPNAP